MPEPLFWRGKRRPVDRIKGELSIRNEADLPRGPSMLFNSPESERRLIEEEASRNAQEKRPKGESNSAFARKALIATGIVIGLLSIIALLWYTIRVLELIFFAILIAVFLRGVADWISSWSRLPVALSLTLVVFALGGLIFLASWTLSPHINEQVSRLGQEIPRSLDRIRGFIEKYVSGSGAFLGGKEGAGKLLGNVGGIFKQLGSFFSITLEAVADAIVVFFLTLYLAYTPELYIQGIVKLVPVGRRRSASDIIHRLGFTLKWWLIGRFTTMTIVGVMSGIGLWILGIPLALTLGILAGLLTFIPYVGPIISAVPAILMALLVNFSHAIYVVFLYIGIHLVEGYILSPLIQERTVYVPPMLLLSALTGMTILLGIPGLIISTPLTAVALVLIKEIYIGGMLGDQGESLSRDVRS